MYNKKHLPIILGNSEQINVLKSCHGVDPSKKNECHDWYLMRTRALEILEHQLLAQLEFSLQLFGTGGWAIYQARGTPF